MARMTLSRPIRLEQEMLCNRQGNRIHSGSSSLRSFAIRSPVLRGSPGRILASRDGKDVVGEVPGSRVADWKLKIIAGGCISLLLAAPPADARAFQDVMTLAFFGPQDNTPTVETAIPIVESGETSFNKLPISELNDNAKSTAAPAVDKIRETKEMLQSQLGQMKPPLANIQSKAEEVKDSVQDNAVGLKNKLQGQVQGQADNVQGNVSGLKNKLQGQVDNVKSDAKSQLGQVKPPLATIQSKAEEVKDAVQENAVGLKNKLQGQVQDQVDNVQGNVSGLKNKLQGQVDSAKYDAKNKVGNLQQPADELKRQASKATGEAKNAAGQATDAAGRVASEKAEGAKKQLGGVKSFLGFD